MILSVELDPIMESIYYLDSFLGGGRNKSSKIINNMEGEAISLAKLLKSLTCQVSIIGFFGGFPGEYILEELKSIEVASEAIRVRDESRRDIILLHNENIISSISGPGPRIIREDINRFFERYANIIDRYNIICGLGQVPSGMDRDIFYNLIDIAKKREKRFLLDLKGDGLFFALDANPFLVKMGKRDLEALTNIEINHYEEVANLGKGIIESGVELLVIDLEEEGSVVLTKDKAYSIEIPNIEVEFLPEDKAYTIAGYAFAMDKGYDFETAMKLGQSSRLAYSLGDKNKVDMTDIKRIMSSLKLEELYY